GDAGIARLDGEWRVQGVGGGDDHALARGEELGEARYGPDVGQVTRGGGLGIEHRNGFNARLRQQSSVSAADRTEPHNSDEGDRPHASPPRNRVGGGPAVPGSTANTEPAVALPTSP